jgi:hypothetical protein
MNVRCMLEKSVMLDRLLYGRATQVCRPRKNYVLPMVMSWMKEPVVDLVTCGSLTQVDGYDVTYRSPNRDHCYTA